MHWPMLLSAEWYHIFSHNCAPTKFCSSSVANAVNSPPRAWHPDAPCLLLVKSCVSVYVKFAPSGDLIDTCGEPAAGHPSGMTVGRVGSGYTVIDGICGWTRVSVGMLIIVGSSTPPKFASAVVIAGFGRISHSAYNLAPHAPIGMAVSPRGYRARHVYGRLFDVVKNTFSHNYAPNAFCTSLSSTVAS